MLAKDLRIADVVLCNNMNNVMCMLLQEHGILYIFLFCPFFYAELLLQR